MNEGPKVAVTLARQIDGAAPAGITDATANNASMVRLAILIVSSSTPERCARLFDTIRRGMTTAAMRRARAQALQMVAWFMF
jgi:hypothetical protein